MNLYDANYWQTCVEPALTKFQIANAGRKTERAGVVASQLRQLNFGCGPHYFPGWLNTDVVRTKTIQPDVLTTAADPLPFANGSFDRAYLGHVLEHMPWPEVVPLLQKLRRVLVPGGTVAVVGPDLKRALAALQSSSDVPGAVSHVWEVAEDRNHYQRNEPEYDWPAARHHWNCYSERVAWALREAGFASVEEYELTPERFGAFPVVDYTNRSQCAVTARA